jgi:pimeloyl-ACP methyl ester carboxylesterase
MAGMTLPETSTAGSPDGRILRYCRYGPADGSPVIMHGGSPTTRWKRSDLIEAMERSKMLLVVYDRPGYGGSTRLPGRRVIDAVDDTRALADALGWPRFALLGVSGGGPHALACAALLADRVTRCAVAGSIKPAEPGRPERDEAEMRSLLAETAAQIMGKVEAGGPEFPPAPGAEPGPPALADPDALARLRATFVDGMDGWADDSLAFKRPWGFEPAAITVPVGIWHGTADPSVPADHADWLLAHIPTARGHAYTGGHLPGPDVYGEIYDWLRG